MMKKLAIPLSLAAAFTLAACAGTTETRVAGSTDSTYIASVGTVPDGGTVRAGIGKVGHPMASDTPVNGTSNQIVTLSMRDGSKQTLVVRGGQLRMAEIVQVGPDGRIRHVVEQ